MAELTDDSMVFKGDVLIQATSDGGDMVMTDGLISDCRDFSTAAYLSLFGGNKDDENGNAKETWWGNLVSGTKRAEWMQSEFGAVITGSPLTSSNLQKAAKAAERDLAWLKTEAGADSVDVSLTAQSKAEVQIAVEIKKDAATSGGTYSFQWEKGA